MTLLPAPVGEFMMGNERERYKVNLGRFCVARYPVTNAQWVRFVAATGHKPLKHWPGGVCPLDKATHPVVYTGTTLNAKARRHGRRGAFFRAFRVSIFPRPVVKIGRLLGGWRKKTEAGP